MKSYFSAEYEILTACNGQEAVRKAQEQPDLILLDINMPGMDGLSKNFTAEEFCRLCSLRRCAATLAFNSSRSKGFTMYIYRLY